MTHIKSEKGRLHGREAALPRSPFKYLDFAASTLSSHHALNQSEADSCARRTKFGTARETVSNRTALFSLTNADTSRPHATGKGALIFPLVVKCVTEEDARQVYKLQELVELIGDKAPLEVATRVSSNTQITGLALAGHFFPVIAGSSSTIYSTWYARF